MKRVYLDASWIVYLVEASSQFHDTAVRRFTAYRNLDGVALTSEMSRLECRVKPMRAGDRTLLACYDEFFVKDGLTVAAIDKRIIDRATELRARYNFRTPDALHMATAIEHQADVVLSGDKDLARCKEVRVELLNDLA